MVGPKAGSRSLVMTDRNHASSAVSASRATAGPERLAPICPNPVFVIGSPRSGTTAVAFSLAEHSELWASGEAHVFSHLFASGLVERAFDRAMLPPGPSLLRLEEVSREEFHAYVGLGINALI